MAETVNPSDPAPGLRALRVARTEAQLIDAATGLFLARGYQATTLAEVARSAGLAPRTVYVRFATKAALFSRVVDRALAGGDARPPVLDQPVLRQAMSGPTLAGRIGAFADACVGIAERVGPLFEVAAQAEGIEPDLAAAFQDGRRETRQLCAGFWQQARADGLLDPALDLDNLTTLTDVLVCADTTVHLRRTGAWHPRQHHALITTTLAALADSPGAHHP